MRILYLLLASITLIVGYVVGTIFGYRTAVVDYVENDAETIEEVADTMYGGSDDEDAEETIEQLVGEMNENDATAFQ